MDNIGNNIAQFLVEKVESLFKDEGLQEFLKIPKSKKYILGYNTLAKVVPVAASSLEPTKRYLVFIHGIFSSIESGFKDVLNNNYGDNLILNLIDRYDRVIGFDHFTVAKTTKENPIGPPGSRGMHPQFRGVPWKTMVTSRNE